VGWREADRQSGQPKSSANPSQPPINRYKKAQLEPGFFVS
jgi:hypothetical protein